ncbi:MAG: hypothetical protein AMJ65_07160 [Phycisphaerae bacterium SG8_4]|nr:MAG: hypothetical protein AMJ65_07160 [Phycisphaerae bacterium SG8_4]
MREGPLKMLVIAAIMALPLTMGAGSAILPYITPFMRTVLDDADAETARDTLEAAGWSATIVNSPTSAGEEGDLWADSGGNYLYVAYGDNQWHRVAIATWTPGANHLLQEDGTSFLLQEDGTSKIILEN